jgi:hemoglobin
MNMKPHRLQNITTTCASVLFVLLIAGCSTDEKKDKDFFTSGSREADQRAEQRVAKDQQIKGKGENTDAKGRDTKAGAKDEEKKPLYQRLGGDTGIAALVDDFIPRVLADPRVNFERKDVKTGGFMGLKQRSVEWKPDAASVGTLKKHMQQFLALATGGPAQYDGGEMKNVHKGMQISNAEFDAAVGDLKTTLDKLQLPVEDQKELLAIIETTRPQVVEQR